LLKEAAPQAARFALLAPEADPAFAFQIREMRDAAALAAIDLVIVGDRGGDYAGAFAGMSRAGVEALVVGAHQFFVRDRREIIALAERHRLPAIYEWSHQVADGGLMSFGASLTERYRRLAAHVDRILKGARPADLPFEQPAALTTVVNLKAARAIGLQLSPAFLARADEVIE
jgi:putative ABC transport system substrate-binding protein